MTIYLNFFFFSSRRRHTRCGRDWSSDECSSDLLLVVVPSVAFCLLLAIHSDFSFSAIPRELLKSVADRAKYPAAPAGYITMQTCKDTTSAVKEIGRASCR